MISLLHTGSTPHAYDSTGKTPLHLACEYGNLSCCNSLIEAGAAVNSLDWGEQRRTPLDLAEDNDHVECYELVKSVGAFSGEEIRNLAATAIQGAWKIFWVIDFFVKQK
jgi:ankyrin repeat protein